jgi:hypothetical protein
MQVLRLQIEAGQQLAHVPFRRDASGPRRLPSSGSGEKQTSEHSELHVDGVPIG